MSGILGKAFSVIAVFAVTWTGAIYYWRSSGTMPTGMQMLAYLGLVPIGLSSAGFMLRNAGRNLLDKAVDAASSEKDDTADSATTTLAPKVFVPSVAVLGAHMRLGTMLDAQALLDQASALPRPPLDARFHDRDGLPLVISADKDLVDDTGIVQAQMPGFDTREGERRAITLLEPVADTLLELALLSLPALEVAQERVVAGLRRRDEQVVAQVLTIEVLVPAEWSAAMRGFCADWMHARARFNGLDPRRFEVNIAVAGSPMEVWSRLQRLTDTLAEGEPRWHLLLACGSAVDRGTIGAWLDSNRIQHHRNKEGQVPGEGAAGVLLASPRLAPAQVPHLWRPQRVDLAQDRTPSQARQDTETLARTLLENAGIAPDRIGVALHDADLRPQLSLEACAAALATNPDLEVGSQTLALPVCAGELGPVLPLALLTLAHTHAMAAQRGALLLSVAAPGQRLAALVDIPVSPEPSADPVSAA